MAFLWCSKWMRMDMGAAWVGGFFALGIGYWVHLWLFWMMTMMRSSGVEYHEVQGMGNEMNP